MRVRAALAVGALVVTALAIGVTPSGADEGDRDPSFGSGGSVALPPFATALLLPDDRVLTYGAVPPSDPTGRSDEWELRRLLPDGSLDPSFGEEGVVRFATTALPIGVGVDGVGRLVVYGSFDSNAGETTHRSYLVRFLPDGELDDIYGTDGRVQLESSIVEQDAFGAVATDGSVFLRRGNVSNEIRRVDAHGVLDSTFADHGVLRIPGFVDVVHASGDRLVVAGTNLSEHSFVGTYTLGGRGLSWAGFDLMIVSAVVQPDGSVVIADRSAFHRLHRADGTPEERLVLHRIRPNGTVDPAFGYDGEVDTGTRAYYDAIAAGPDARLYAWSGSGGFARAFTRDGMPIGTYGECGWGGRGMPVFDRVLGVDHDGRVLVVASAPSPAGLTPVLLRLQGDDGGPPMDASPDSQTWVVTPDGFVADLGLACWHDDLRFGAPTEPVVGIAATTSGDGYSLAAGDGGVFSFGDAEFHGSLGGAPLSAPIVGIAATPTGRGYWLVAADGGVFAFGDAEFHGSLGATQLATTIVGMAARPSGHGYWLVGRDGSVFTFGDAPFAGAAPGERVAVGIAPTASGTGYWVLHQDGGLAPFGDASVPNDRGSFIYSPAYSPGPAVAIEPTVASPGFRRLFTTCCPEQLATRRPVGWDIR